ncbi:unnamed protein product [Ilex paraguariensis]|uniref:EF-hand domain-containing protein n=1 Tax=Ilex paraguariensis TaxID=185542 RepID=A0ABC8RNI0_9AQUA
MSKAVLCTLLATAFVLLIFLSRKTKTSPKDYGPHSLNRRLGYKLTPPIFDPLVAKMERMAEEKGNGNQDSNKPEDMDEYFNHDGRLNITLRLMVLFPFLDTAPKDGMIDSKELEAWVVQQAIDRLNYRIQRELAWRDKDRDGAISFSEYLHQFSDEDIERNEMGHGEAGWWKEQFMNADLDQNGTLSFYEFRDFLHPEDSNNEKIQMWLLRGKMRQMDLDKDQKLNLLEFQNGAYDTYKSYLEFENGGAGAPGPEDVFAKLDVNKDKLLSVEELKPILRYLSHGELSYAKYYASYLMNEADENRDEKLSLNEMLKHEFIFYNTVYDESSDDDDHDEL